MWKKRLLLYFLVLTLLFSMLGCRPKSNKEKALEFYIKFQEDSLEDRYAAAIKYVHFEHESVREIALECVVDDTLISYEVLEIIELSDSLWVLRVLVASAWFPEETEYFNFVGIIDGEFRVMNGYISVPEELSENIDLTPYRPKGDYIDPRNLLPITPEDPGVGVGPIGDID